MFALRMPVVPAMQATLDSPVDGGVYCCQVNGATGGRTSRLSVQVPWKIAGRSAMVLNALPSFCGMIHCPATSM